MSKKDQLNIVVAGLSGQGVIMFSKLLTSVFKNSEYNVLTYEVLGTAHRGTLIFSHIRISKSPNVCNNMPAGCGDVLIGVEPLEGLRTGAYYLKNNGLAILNSKKIIPMYASIGRDFTSDKPRPLGYPSLDYIHNFFKELGIQTISIDATEMAQKAGHFSATNMVLLGCLMATDLVPISAEELKEGIKSSVPAGTEEINIKAFDMGFDFYFQSKGQQAV